MILIQWKRLYTQSQYSEAAQTKWIVHSNAVRPRCRRLVKNRNQKVPEGIRNQISCAGPSCSMNSSRHFNAQKSTEVRTRYSRMSTECVRQRKMNHNFFLPPHQTKSKSPPLANTVHHAKRTSKANPALAALLLWINAIVAQCCCGPMLLWINASQREQTNKRKKRRRPI